MKKTLLFISMLAILTGFRVIASRTINGNVYDDKKHPLAGVNVHIEGLGSGTTTDTYGHYTIVIPDGNVKLVFTYIGYHKQVITIGKENTLNITLKADNVSLNEVVVVGFGVQKKSNLVGGTTAPADNRMYRMYAPVYDSQSDESYGHINENKFLNPQITPLSTFAADVDAASYSNMRRFINSGQLPPKNAVRIEEMVNYFKYNLPEPTNGAPVAIQTELATAPLEYPTPIGAHWP